MADGIFEYNLVVEAADIDPQGHANNVVYLRWAQEAAIAHSDAVGWTAERYREEGVSWVVRRHEIEYRQAAGQGDTITIRTWVENLRGAASERRYEFIRSRDGALLARARTDWALIGIPAGAPRRIPLILRQAFGPPSARVEGRDAEQGGSEDGEPV